MWPRRIIGVVLVVVGVVWVGQGLGAIGGSFMSDQAEWAVIGAFSIALGVALLVAANRIDREDKFFTTPHYDGHPMVLVPFAAVDVDELTELLTESWRIRAPKRVREAFDAEVGGQRA